MSRSPARARIELGASFPLVAPESPFDFRLENHGPICLLHPLTPTAVAWVNAQIDDSNGYQPQWPTVLIEPCYLASILNGLAADGLRVA
jgi:hypothetical protein